MVLTSGKEEVSPVDEFLNEVNPEIRSDNRSLKRYWDDAGSKSK